ncbi:ABC transporter substrate-binding protein [Salicola sp. Rm-C-2C1-2]|uniref:substrate-binding periplasmic protein n=1 Tax=Salicola sp. Rm-C-2C1-2 TaxID=3141321 RepID=UPI0032E380E4
MSPPYRRGSQQTKVDFRVVALENGFEAVKQQRNSVLFSIARTEERENNFKWVCPIDQLRTQLVGLKSRDFTINNDNDLKHYDIGTIKGDVGEELLKKAGVPQSRMSYGNEYNNLTRLINGQTDLYVVSMDNVASSCQNRACDVSQFKPVYTLKVTDLCYALNKATADSVVGQLQTALDELHDKGRVEALKDKYTTGR